MGREGNRRYSLSAAYRETGADVDVEDGLVGVNLGVHVSPHVPVVIREPVVTHVGRKCWFGFWQKAKKQACCFQSLLSLSSRRYGGGVRAIDGEGKPLDRTKQAPLADYKEGSNQEPSRYIPLSSLEPKVGEGKAPSAAL